MRKIFTSTLFILLCPLLVSQESDTSRLSLVFAGDIMGHDEQIVGAWDTVTKTYNYEPTFRYIRPFIEKADIAIANLEVTLAGPPYKGYPQFSSPDALAIAAQNAGFDIFVQANNHALDRGKSGFIRTLDLLDSLNIIHTGTFKDSESRRLNYPLILEKNNIRISLLNYTYGTNGIEIPIPFIINRIDTIVMKDDLEKARLAGPDHIIVTIHWGEEYQRVENQQQRRLAEFLLRNGADVIIGSHPHVIQPVKVAFDSNSNVSTIVVYSLGNFVSNQRAQFKDGGIVFEIKLIKTAQSTRVEDFSYMPSWVYREDIHGKSTFYILPVSLYEKDNSIIKLKDYDLYKIARFSEDTRAHLKNIPENLFWSDE